MTSSSGSLFAAGMRAARRRRPIYQGGEETCDGHAAADKQSQQKYYFEHDINSVWSLSFLGDEPGQLLCLKTAVKRLNPKEQIGRTSVSCGI
jgi:hypothetical protein